VLTTFEISSVVKVALREGGKIQRKSKFSGGKENQVVREKEKIHGFSIIHGFPNDPICHPTHNKEVIKRNEFLLSGCDNTGFVVVLSFP
jgi:hypothetical protein